MENNVQIFNYKEKNIRVLGTPEKPLFCASDVCDALEYKSGRNTIRRLFNGDVPKCTILTNGGKQQVSFLTEPQLYRLIMKSDAKNAEPFQDWVCNEVLPSIRKNGGYINNQENMTPEQILAHAMIVANNVIEEQKRQIAAQQQTIQNKNDVIEQQEDTIIEQRETILVQQPKVELHDQLMSTENGLSIRDAIRHIRHLFDKNFKENDVFSYLYNKKYLLKPRGSKSPLPNATLIRNELMKVVSKTVTNRRGDIIQSQQALVLPSGIEWLIKTLSTKFNLK